jgi:hypothetical protein
MQLLRNRRPVALGTLSRGFEIACQTSGIQPLASAPKQAAKAPGVMGQQAFQRQIGGGGGGGFGHCGSKGERSGIFP